MQELNEKVKMTRQEAGHKGGQAISRDRGHMADIGRKGGQTVSRDRAHMSEIGRKGGESVSRDRSHMEAIGRKGGEAPHERRGRQAPEAREAAPARPVGRRTGGGTRPAAPRPGEEETSRTPRVPASRKRMDLRT